MPDPDLLRNPSDLALELRLDSPERADLAILRALRERAPGRAAPSRSSLKALFREGRARLRGHSLAASALLAPGRHEVVLVGLGEELWRQGAEARPAPPDDALARVIHDDPELLVLDKPSGLPSVPHSPTEIRTAVSFALARAPELAGIGRGGLEPGLLHRLDTGTSGLLAFARTSGAYERLHAAWKSGAVRKTYRALVTSPQGAALPTHPVELAPWLGHDAKSARRMRAFSDPDRPDTAIRGRPLPTQTRIITARTTSQAGVLDLEIEITTGVMHQIRCTLAWLGWPVLGDPIYRGAPSPRLWLHAWKLRLPQPDGRSLELEAELPPNWDAPHQD